MSKSRTDRDDSKASRDSESSMGSTTKLTVWLIYLSLAIVTLAIYWQVHEFEFVNFDDDLFVSQNPYATGGLTGRNFAWSFGIHGPGQWHPMAWWVHQFNCQFFGLQPGAHHMVNVVLHVAATLVLLTALWRLTKNFWPSALVATLHALHPLSVESVAWISHLREPLSMLFWGLVMWSYAVYARRGGTGRYLLVLLLFAMGLMAKPTLITLPCVLLLLDWWPLNRLAWGAERTAAQSPLGRLVFEKLPLLALALVAAWLAYLCQKSMGSVVTLENHPTGARLANAAQSYVLYLRNMVWPSSLAPLYPLPKSFHPALVTSAVAFLAAITASAWYFGRQRRYLLVGWLWYLGTLVPVIGLLKMGAMTAMTDHYMYVSLLGIYIAIAWLLADWAERSSIAGRSVKPILIGAVAVLLFVMLPITWRQTGIWRDTETLWTHTLKVTRDNSIAHNNLGSAVQKVGHTEEALAHYQESLRINSGYAEAYINLGSTFQVLGRPQEAVSYYEKALKIDPSHPELHFNYGITLQTLNRLPEAVEHYREAVRINSNYFEAHNNCGVLLNAMGQPQEAVEHYLKALAINSESAEVHNNCGVALNAIQAYQEAEVHLKESLRIKPGDFRANYNCGIALQALGRSREAVDHFEKALQIDPDDGGAHYGMAWMLATSREDEDLDGERAIKHAKRAVQLMGDDHPFMLDALAAAYAEAGKFEEAVQTQKKAIQHAKEAVKPALNARLELYRQHRPYRRP